VLGDHGCHLAAVRGRVHPRQGGSAGAPIGSSVQFPARQAIERDEARIAAWRQEVWPVAKGPNAPRIVSRPAPRQAP